MVVVVVEEVDVVVAQPVAVHASQQLANDPAHALPFLARDGNREQFDALKCFEVPTPNPLRDSLSEQRFPHLPLFGLRMKPYAHNCRAE